jgi:hypothetical protein
MTDTRARDLIAASLHLILDECDRREHPKRNDITYPCQFMADAALAALSDAGLVVLDRTLLDGLLDAADDVKVFDEAQPMRFARALAAVVEAVGPTREDTK